MNRHHTLLRVTGLRTVFLTASGPAAAVDSVSFTAQAGRLFALVGESGCGKSALALSLLRLLPDAGRVAAGCIELNGRNLLDLTERQMRSVRGRRIGMVFQEPATALNPIFTCGRQIVEAIRLHQSVGARRAKEIAVQSLARLGVDEPAKRFRQYPHELSGGLRQRVLIAMALAGQPDLLIADEPTTALDTATQQRILDLLTNLPSRAGMGVVLITHDLALVARAADTVAVMYAGELMEIADTRALFAYPMHPYTQALLDCVRPVTHTDARFAAIPGCPPDLASPPPGCRFHPRCPLAADNPLCRSVHPQLRLVAQGHWSACLLCPGYDHTLPYQQTHDP